MLSLCLYFGLQGDKFPSHIHFKDSGEGSIKGMFTEAVVYTGFCYTQSGAGDKI